MTTDNGPIRLHHPGAATTIQAEDVYFTFASRRLSYDCVTCNAKCCRGYGYLTTVGKELQRQLEMRPSLPLFFEPSDETKPQQYRIGNCAPGCFFLTESGRCDIHSRLGYDAKPETCRLFPFNNLRRLGSYLVVRPHPSLCPLEVAPPGRTSECSDHDALLGTMRGQGIAARVPMCTIGDGNAGQVIAFERRVVELSERFVERDDYLEFVREQLRLQESEGLLRPGRDAPRVEAILQVIRELIDVPEIAAVGSDADVVRTMIAVTPFLRSQLVFQDTSPEPAASGLPLEYARVVIAILCIYLFAETARASGMRRVTFQTISQLAHDFDPLARLLAWSDTPMVWQRGVAMDVAGFGRPEFGMAFIRLSKALLPGAQRKRQASLGDLLREHVPADRVDRALFLKQAAKYLAGKVVPLNDEAAVRFNAGPRARLTSAVRRWVLGNVPEAVLQAAYERVNTARTPSSK